MTNTIKTAIEHLKRGEIIGIPTETVYGLAVDAGSNAALDALYALKGRDSGKPFQMMVPDIRAAEKLVTINARARKIMEAFCPGPISVVLPCKEGDGTLAIRIPNNLQTLHLLEEFKKPLATTSANLAGEASSISAEEVKELFPQLFVLEGGKNCLGIASTVVDLTDKEIKILREGSITLSQCLAAIKSS